MRRSNKMRQRLAGSGGPLLKMTALMDIFSTLAEIVGLPQSAMLSQDGASLDKLFTRDLEKRSKPIPFQCFGETALIDNNFKLVQLGRRKRQPQRYELYDLQRDPTESHNLFEQDTELAERMTAAMAELQASIQASFKGADYPEKKLQPEDPEPRFWTAVEGYRQYFEAWKSRPEYRSRLKGF